MIKAKYVLVLVISLLSLSLSLVALSYTLSRNGVPEGVKEVELFNDILNDVTFDGQDYIFILRYFEPFCESCSLKVEYTSGSASGSVTRRISLDKGIEICGFWVFLKESRFDSVVVWIKKES